ncbi:MAG: hypothetical protein A3J46_00765 [Candidatus Yanofskybacteria bacterium RIFCSPHIGHO2_02_FULL_41_11]|uniref:Glycosyltransferase 2-like domain-containing protein n=1 Tax=Candidatus Yanofskybacteria bacterium RIFCSPHIGHO2_02_FULL_41_11 TaxID=1802675 RepID=A0A1F8FBG2_9BACT|nr:MAG: hypothetical protein A3J46_00765 [Candidatus Yanofskybacteria bacterium RIFCSPHIGHO2_02_FULL_41_11]
MNKPYHIVITTIFHPLILDELFDNISKHDHLDETKIWIVGDKKTPGSVGEFAKRISSKGLETIYVDVATQEEWGKEYTDFYRCFPYNTQSRRGVGFPWVLQDGCEILILIDDDNFPTGDDFIGGHANTGKIWNGQMISEPVGFHNVCEYLEFEPSRHVFTRGFPFHLRDTRNNPVRKTEKPVRIGATAGLWLSAPDVDATTWLNGRISGVKYKGEPTNVLHQDTWAPINTQNTSILRELIPAFVPVPMGWDVPGGKIDWYNDIWGGYFFQALTQGMPYNVAFGRPLVDHRRNPHEYINDLRQEFWGIILTDWLVNLLKADFRPISLNILDRLGELADFLEEKTDMSMPAWTPAEMKSFMKNISGTMRQWSKVCEKIMK